MCQVMQQLGVAIDGGKGSTETVETFEFNAIRFRNHDRADSLSMAAKVKLDTKRAEVVK